MFDCVLVFGFGWAVVVVCWVFGCWYVSSWGWFDLRWCLCFGFVCLGLACARLVYVGLVVASWCLNFGAAYVSGFCY